MYGGPIASDPETLNVQPFRNRKAWGQSREIKRYHGRAVPGFRRRTAPPVEVEAATWFPREGSQRAARGNGRGRAGKTSKAEASKSLISRKSEKPGPALPGVCMQISLRAVDPKDARRILRLETRDVRKSGEKALRTIGYRAINPKLKFLAALSAATRSPNEIRAHRVIPNNAQ